MDIAMMQPAFMPWQGFFELIYKSEIFIFLDDFQFSVQSYHQRNRLFTSKGEVGWYTVPVQKSVSFKAPLNKTTINTALPWKEKIWKRIESNYSKAEFFGELAPHIKNWLFTDAHSLAEQNIAFIKLVCDLLGFKRHFRYSSEYATESKRSKRVLELIRRFKGKRYFCANGAFEYMFKDNNFPDEGVEILFQDFTPRAHKQIGATGGFIPFLSIADALMNIGPEATVGIVKNGTKKWLTWDEMALKNASPQHK